MSAMLTLPISRIFRAFAASLWVLAAACLGSCSREESPPRPAAAPPAPAPPRGALVPVVRGPLTIAPRGEVYFFTVQGQGGSEDVTLTSRLDRPLALRAAASDNPLFSATLAAIEPGRRWRLTVALDPRAPAGRHQGRVRLLAGDPARPAADLPVRAIVEEVVGAAPPRFYFGSVRAAELDRDEVAVRRVLVRSHRRDPGPGGQRFQVLGAETDLPDLALAVAPGLAPQSYLVTARLLPGKVRRGPLRGKVVVRTSDAGFQRLEIPVIGTVL
jgi:hypothetical protein